MQQYQGASPTFGGAGAPPSPGPPTARASTGSYQLPLQSASAAIGLSPDAAAAAAGSSYYSTSSNSTQLGGAPSQLLQRRHSAFSPQRQHSGEVDGLGGAAGRVSTGGGLGGIITGAAAGQKKQSDGLPINFSHSRGRARARGRLSCLSTVLLLVALVAAAGLCAAVAKANRHHRALVDHHYTARGACEHPEIPLFCPIPNDSGALSRSRCTARCSIVRAIILCVHLSVSKGVSTCPQRVCWLTPPCFCCPTPGPSPSRPQGWRNTYDELVSSHAEARRAAESAAQLGAQLAEREEEAARLREHLAAARNGPTRFCTVASRPFLWRVMRCAGVGLRERCRCVGSARFCRAPCSAGSRAR